MSLASQWKATKTLALAVALRERGYTGPIRRVGTSRAFACSDLLRDFHELDPCHRPLI